MYIISCKEWQILVACNARRQVENYINVSAYSFMKYLSVYYVVAGPILVNGINFITTVTKVRVVFQGNKVFLCQEKDSWAIAITVNHITLLLYLL